VGKDGGHACVSEQTEKFSTITTLNQVGERQSISTGVGLMWNKSEAETL
jgi:hypothetical protein